MAPSPGTPSADQISMESDYQDASVSVSEALHEKSTSTWGTKQLNACRVWVKRSNYKLLPSISPSVQENRAFASLKKASISAESGGFWEQFPDSRKALRALIDGPGRAYMDVTSDHKLCRILDSDIGSVWASLHRLAKNTVLSPELTTGHGDKGVIQSDPPVQLQRDLAPGLPPCKRGASPSSLSTPPPRSRSRTTLASGMVPFNSDVTIESSPSAHLSTSSPLSSAFVPDSEALSDRERPEKLTVDFFNAFVRYVLRWVPPQHVMPETNAEVVDLDVASPTRLVNIMGKVRFTSIDDGSLRVSNGSLAAIIEMKSSLCSVIDGKVLPSDEWLGQIVGESLAVRLRGQEWGGPPEIIYVIAPSRYFVRFFEVHISEKYLAELKASIISDCDFHERIIVKSTSLLDLREAEGRLDAVRNISAITYMAMGVTLGDLEEGI